MIANIIRLKTPKQIEGIRKSSQLAASTLEYIKPFVVAGVTTQELNDKIEQYIRDHGALPAPLGYNGYPAASCISINEVICHGIPGKQVLKEGDIVNIDVTTILDGYYGDTSQMFSIEPISKEASDLMEATKTALWLGINQVRPGVKTGVIGETIRQYAWKKGYSVVDQFCGHGVGLEFHEPPNINHASSKNEGPIMTAGMTFTIEPMLNVGVALAVIDEQDHWTARTLDGSLSAQYEHTVLVTEFGFEVLSLVL